jgi:hypothetical protein
MLNQPIHMISLVATRRGLRSWPRANLGAETTTRNGLAALTLQKASVLVTRFPNSMSASLLAWKADWIDPNRSWHQQLQRSKT